MGHFVSNFFLIGVSEAIGRSCGAGSATGGSGEGGATGSEDFTATVWGSAEEGAGLDSTKGVAVTGSLEMGGLPNFSG